MTVTTTTTPVGNPLVIGVLVSPIKDLESALAAYADATRQILCSQMPQPAE